MFIVSLRSVCDFIITKSSRQFGILCGPPLSRNRRAENRQPAIRPGAMHRLDVCGPSPQSPSSTPIDAVFGVVTTGSAWKFLRLQHSVVTLDVKEYYIDNAAKILGVLRHILESA